MGNLRAVVADGAAYALGVLLSCGPSQIFGIVKGTIDLVKLAMLQVKISKVEDEICKLQQAVSIGNKKITVLTNIEEQLEIKLAEYTEHLSDFESKTTDLKADTLALLPFVGAIFSWRLYSKDIAGPSTAGYEYAVPQLAKDCSKKLAGMILYPLSGKKREFEGYPEGQVKIPVIDASGKRMLYASYWRHDPDKARETVVIFHGNGMTADDMGSWQRYYYRQGYDVLAPTMGGYPGSDPVETCEASTYCDVNAIKQFLQAEGVSQAGYHGLSIGGTLAFQAAVGETTAAKVQTKFVVADQTFTTASEVAANVVENVGAGGIAPLARGSARAAVPAGRQVRLDKNTITKTDGLDNRAKAERLKAGNIPLLVIASNQDRLMGKNKQENDTFTHNFADELFEARYGAQGGPVDTNKIMLDGGHCSFFGSDMQAVRLMKHFLKASMPRS